MAYEPEFEKSIENAVKAEIVDNNLRIFELFAKKLLAENPDMKEELDRVLAMMRDTEFQESVFGETHVQESVKGSVAALKSEHKEQFDKLNDELKFKKIFLAVLQSAGRDVTLPHTRAMQN